MKRLVIPHQRMVCVVLNEQHECIRRQADYFETLSCSKLRSQYQFLVVVGQLPVPLKVGVVFKKDVLAIAVKVVEAVLSHDDLQHRAGNRFFFLDVTDSVVVPFPDELFPDLSFPTREQRENQQDQSSSAHKQGAVYRKIGIWDRKCNRSYSPEDPAFNCLRTFSTRR